MDKVHISDFRLKDPIQVFERVFWNRGSEFIRSILEEYEANVLVVPGEISSLFYTDPIWMGYYKPCKIMSNGYIGRFLKFDLYTDANLKNPFLTNSRLFLVGEK